MSMEVGTQRVGPAPSGAPISFDSGGTRRAPVQKHRSSMLAPTPDTAKRSTMEGAACQVLLISQHSLPSSACYKNIQSC